MAQGRGWPKAGYLLLFIPLYTLAGFYICSLLQCFSSYFRLQLSYLQNFSSLIFDFYISYIPHFPSSWSFSRLFFSNVLSSSFPTLFLPISFQLSSLSVGHQIFRIRNQLFYSYFFCQMQLFQFSYLLDYFSAFYQFGPTYFTHVVYTNCQISNFLLVCFFLISSFSVSILAFHCPRISIPSVNTRHSLQNVVFQCDNAPSPLLLLFTVI